MAFLFFLSLAKEIAITKHPNYRNLVQSFPFKRKKKNVFTKYFSRHKLQPSERTLLVIENGKFRVVLILINLFLVSIKTFGQAFPSAFSLFCRIVSLDLVELCSLQHLRENA